MPSYFGKSVEILSYAKLNLFLDVLGKRPDGYHDLVTLFERISLFDKIRLTALSSDEIVISSKGEEIPLDENNLAYKAANLLKQSLNVKTGVRIEIEKNIPVGAGLAGGSSNAAAVLVGLNKLFNLKLSKASLMRYAGRLGSDVAFFVFNKTFAVGRGRGGELSSVLLPKKYKLWHILFSPSIKVMTKDVYGLLDREQKQPKKRQKHEKSYRLTKNIHDVNILLSYLRKRKGGFLLNRNIYNRLSETVMNSYRLVSDLKSEINRFGLKYVHMSGSGPTLFCIFMTKGQAQKAYLKLSRLTQGKCRVFLVSSA